MEFEPDKEDIVWCKAACGNNIHKVCFDKWAATQRAQGVRCVYWCVLSPLPSSTFFCLVLSANRQKQSLKLAIRHRKHRRRAAQEIRPRQRRGLRQCRRSNGPIWYSGYETIPVLTPSLLLSHFRNMLANLHFLSDSSTYYQPWGYRGSYYYGQPGRRWY